MIVTFDRSPTRWAVRWASSHSAVVTLSGHRTARTSSSRISAAVPGSVRRPVVEAPQVGLEGLAEASRPLGHLERGEPVDVDLGGRGAHGAKDLR